MVRSSVSFGGTHFFSGGFTHCRAMSAHHSITEKGNGEHSMLEKRNSKVKTREKDKIKAKEKKTAYQWGGTP